MLREGELKDFSNGRLFGAEDMVRADCHDCTGCTGCCRGMGDTIELDPMDIYRLCSHTGMSAKELFTKALELHVDRGLVLPNLALRFGRENDACFFLSPSHRCSVHPARPGICRLFPLGRIYREGEKGFKYFLQEGECRNTSRSKIRVKKWVDVPEFARYEAFVADWHEYVRSIQRKSPGRAESLLVLNTFFLTDYDTERDFYGQFYERLGDVL